MRSNPLHKQVTGQLVRTLIETGEGELLILEDKSNTIRSQFHLSLEVLMETSSRSNVFLHTIPGGEYQLLLICGQERQCRHLFLPTHYYSI